MYLGNTVDHTRPFAGFLDNFRVYGSTADGTGALSLDKLEQLRQIDMIPEPGAVTLLLLGTACLGWAGRRHHRRHLR